MTKVEKCPHCGAPMSFRGTSYTTFACGTTRYHDSQTRRCKANVASQARPQGFVAESRGGVA
jgi:primosomal protein N'